MDKEKWSKLYPGSKKGKGNSLSYQLVLFCNGVIAPKFTGK
ncbi:MAG TPA: hypothetical protein VK469_00730 [Candidatus Kapabacteria bacterium]|nr:hypothetical protein [Candidatus Kapabacteria bacterium]